MSTLTIGELSERSGVPASALRFYESKGLLWPARALLDGWRAEGSEG